MKKFIIDIISYLRSLVVFLIYKPNIPKIKTRNNNLKNHSG